MKKLLLSLLMLCFTLIVLAVPACPDSIQVEQPDGTLLWTRVHGDEFYHWRSTMDGHVLLRDSLQYYRYATVVDGTLVPSTMVAHDVTNRTADETQYLQANKTTIQNFVRAEIQVAQMVAKAEMELAMMSDAETIFATQSSVTPNGGIHGSRKVLTILMEFEDRRFTKTAADFNRLMNQESGMVDANKGSVRQFYREDSYNNLDISSTVVGPYTANFKSSYYKREQGGSTQQVRELVREALHRASEHGVDFSTLDGDGDGYVDCVHIVFAGRGLAQGQPSDGLIWEHKSYLASAIIRDGKKAKQYIITPELSYENTLAPIGTICHELGHILGAPDFYDTQNPDGSKYYATGSFDIMGGGSWNDGGHTPSHNNAYTKCFLFGWGAAEMITSATKTHQIPSSTLSPRFYRIDTQTEGEFFLVENRTKTNFDTYIPNAGLVVYHIHKDLAETIEDDDPVNSAHPLKCYIVNASAATNPTASQASYGTKSALRAFGGSNMFLTSSSTPSFKAWNGSSTGVNLCFIRQTGNNVEFTVNPQIQGSNQLCGENTYCIGGTVPGAASINWSYYSSIKASTLQPVLRISDKSSACATVQRGFEMVRTIDSSLINPPIIINPPIQMSTMAESAASSSFSLYKRPYVGEATLFATVSSGGEEYTMSKTIILPQNIQPGLDLKSQQRPIWVVGQTFSFTEKNCNSLLADQIKWYVRYPQATEDVVLIGRTVNIKPTQSGKLTIRIVNDCGCETQNETTYSFSVREQYVELQYANPTNGSVLQVQVVETPVSTESYLLSSAQTYTYDNDLQAYTLELWSGTLGRSRSITTTQRQVDIDIVGIPAGWYQLLLLQEGEIIEANNVYINH